jgi:hypothetical protein
LIIKPLSFSKISIGRAWRIEYEGALYHLMSRGNDADRNLFLETISEMSERFKVDIFAYVLMTNKKLGQLSSAAGEPQRKIIFRNSKSNKDWK